MYQQGESFEVTAIEVGSARGHGTASLPRGVKGSSESCPAMVASPPSHLLPCQMVEGATSPPSLLTEADLIALMEKHGIGEGCRQ